MENSKLITILKCLSGKQVKQLRDFINSPYFNKKEEVLKIYDSIIQFYPDFVGEKVEKEYIFSLALPNEPYNEKELGYWMSDLVELIEQFIVVEEILQQPGAQFPHLFKTYLIWNGKCQGDIWELTGRIRSHLAFGLSPGCRLCRCRKAASRSNESRFCCRCGVRFSCRTDLTPVTTIGGGAASLASASNRT